MLVTILRLVAVLRIPMFKRGEYVAAPSRFFSTASTLVNYLNSCQTLGVCHLREESSLLV